ncbi:hypothetical protein C7974DRAFT_425260 [Boeremia exigua]|uniref:uncharacterized protein n=1 Tax=Boeremia exigua TaxID=749465 RepID=UPI001E8EEAEC|nr:uncharacterized protein C7974DRAFT_425260 [Boeremia exigua]KAH6625629.1 hypothetical protein C7974DRAFT_425260 [Boeremia exigua]
MSQRAPQTLSVKRKRTEAPVDALIFDNSVKRQRSETDIFFRRLTKPGDAPQDPNAATPTTERRFHLDPVSRLKSKHVFIERRAASPPRTASPPPQAVPEPAQTRPRKRPGTRAASSAAAPSTPAHRSQPSAHDVRELEALAHRLDAPAPSPLKYKPKAPHARFAERSPAKAAALAAHDDADAMDIDTEYVIDTYVRVSQPASTLASHGTVGYLVLAADDDEWWTGSDSEPEADSDEDSNAEEYYGNDYPEDEGSEGDDSDDGEGFAGAKGLRGDEEFYAGGSGSEDAGSGDEDDLHYKMTVPKALRQGYWGMKGEAA